MIAHMDLTATYCTAWPDDDVYHFRPSRYVYVTTCYRPPEKPSRAELARRYWEYVSCFTPKFEAALLPVFRLIRNVQVPRIHHERQYPRIIKYRNNRQP